MFINSQPSTIQQPTLRKKAEDVILYQERQKRFDPEWYPSILEKLDFEKEVHRLMKQWVDDGIEEPVHADDFIEIRNEVSMEEWLEQNKKESTEQKQETNYVSRLHIYTGCDDQEMTWGQYKGSKIVDVWKYDRQYFNWVEEKCYNFLNRNLKQALKDIHQRERDWQQEHNIK